MCAAVQLDSFVLEHKQRTVRRFFDDFTQPAIVRIIEVDEDFKLSAPHFARNAQFWVFDKHRQQRVLFRSSNDRYISISLDSPVKLHRVYRHADGPTTTLKELFKNSRDVGDLKVALNDDPDLILSNRPDLNDAVAYGELTAVTIMEEACLIGQTMSGSALEPRLTLISTMAPLVLDSVVGIQKKSSSYFRQLTEALRQQQIHPSTALLTSSSPSDIVLLRGRDDAQHSSILYIISKDRSEANNTHLSQMTTTQPEQKDSRLPGDGDEASGGHKVAQDTRPDIESLRKRFERSGPSREEEEWDKRSAQRLGPPRGYLPSRAFSQSSVAAALPPSVYHIRLQQKSRSLSQEDLLDACQEKLEEQPVLNQAHARSLANVLGIGDDSCKLTSSSSTAFHASHLDEDDGYESIRMLSGLSLGPASTGKNESASAVAAMNNLSRPPPPDPRALSATMTKAKSQSRLGFGLHRKKKNKPPAPDHYLKLRPAPTDEHMYAEVTELEYSSRDAEPRKRRKWKHASEIPRDVDVASLTVDEVARCLELLKLRKYARKFRDRVVDGAVLVTVTESMLIDSFKMDQIDARKLIMFARESWRPSK